MDCKRLPANRQIFNWCPRARCTVKTVCKSVHVMGKKTNFLKACVQLVHLFIICTWLVHLCSCECFSSVQHCTLFLTSVEPNTCTQFNHKILPTSTVRQVCEAPCCGCCECSGRTFMKGASLVPRLFAWAERRKEEPGTNCTRMRVILPTFW